MFSLLNLICIVMKLIYCSFCSFCCSLIKLCTKMEDVKYDLHPMAIRMEYFVVLLFVYLFMHSDLPSKSKSYHIDMSNFLK